MRSKTIPGWLVTSLEGMGIPQDVMELLYPQCNRLFTRPTLAQSIALVPIVWREHPITVRGVFYRAVSAGIYPDTAEKHYRQCASILLTLRRRNVLDYRCIVDSTRRRLKPSSWSGLLDYADTVSEAYRKDLWEKQRDYIEIFVEKDAMAAVIEPITSQFDIHLNVIRGCVSETFVWTIAQEWLEIDKPIHAYYLGDHDPAGLSIENDLRTRLEEHTGSEVYWQRLAITDEDFKREDLLGFPVKGERNTKSWQTKHAQYIRNYGDRCIEVDALPASEIRECIQSTIESHINRQAWQMLQVTEKLEKESFKELIADFVLAQKIGGASS